MNASSWIALASLAGFGLLQTAVFAYFMGTLTQRVKGIETLPRDTDCKAELAVLASRFAAMEELVKELGHDINLDPGS